MPLRARRHTKVTVCVCRLLAFKLDCHICQLGAFTIFNGVSPTLHLMVPHLLFFTPGLGGLTMATRGLATISTMTAQATSLVTPVVVTRGIASPASTHHFDKHQFMKKLADGGFKPDEAQVVMESLSEVITSRFASSTPTPLTEKETLNSPFSLYLTSIQNVRQGVVTKVESEKVGCP